MLSHLVYVSNRSSNCTAEEIDKILSSCKRNNPPLTVTGVLLYSETKFIQLVEGEAKVLMPLYDKIKKDLRHTNPIIISYGPIKDKSFPSWHMATKNISKNAVDYKTEISRDDKAIFNNILMGKEESSQKILTLLKKFF